MANYCKNCGTPLKEGAKFCTMCGKGLALNVTETPQEPEKTAPKAERTVPGVPKSEASVEKPAAAEQETKKAPVDTETLPNQRMNAAERTVTGKTEQTAAAKITENPISSLAPSACGESVLGSFGGLGNTAASTIPGTAKLLAASVKSFCVSLKSALKNPKTLIIPLALAGLWLVLDILQVLKINIFPVRVLSFLTFAKGGLYGGFFGFIGGIVGKGVFAGAVMSIATLLMRKGGGKKQSLRDTITKGFGFSRDSLGGYLAGIGAAMLLYLFISGGMVRVGLPVGLAAAYLTAKATLRRGFLQNLIGSFTSKGKARLGTGAIGMMKGMIVGFVAAALIGLLQIKLVIILSGILLTVGGIVVAVLQATSVIKLKKGGDAT